MSLAVPLAPQRAVVRVEAAHPVGQPPGEQRVVPVLPEPAVPAVAVVVSQMEPDRARQVPQAVAAATLAPVRVPHVALGLELLRVRVGRFAHLALVEVVLRGPADPAPEHRDQAVEMEVQTVAPLVVAVTTASVRRHVCVLKAMPASARNVLFHRDAKLAMVRGVQVASDRRAVDRDGMTVRIVHRVLVVRADQIAVRDPIAVQGRVVKAGRAVGLGQTVLVGRVERVGQTAVLGRVGAADLVATMGRAAVVGLVATMGRAVVVGLVAMIAAPVATADRVVMVGPRAGR